MGKHIFTACLKQLSLINSTFAGMMYGRFFTKIYPKFVSVMYEKKLPSKISLLNYVLGGIFAFSLCFLLVSLFIRLSVSPSVRHKVCGCQFSYIFHRFFLWILTKLHMIVDHHVQLCISSQRIDLLIFVGVMPLFDVELC